MRSLLPLSSVVVISRWCVLFWLSMLSGSLHAQLYVAGFSDSRWAAQSGPFACSLSHKIPGFGNAVFSRKAGNAEVFELHQDKVTLPVGVVTMEAVPPSWRQDLMPVALGQVQAVAGKTAVQLTAVQFSTLLVSLEKGMRVLFSSHKVSDLGTSMRVGLEAQQFLPAYKTYKQCITQLIPYSFQQVSRTSIHYDGKADSLSAAAKSQLDKVIRYAKADSAVLGIVVDAHSEKLIDPANAEAASKLNAELVAAYLVEQGLSQDKITTRWHGDKFPIASNLTAAGKAQNRRVTVRLENAETRRETEQKIADRKAAEEKLAENKAAEEKTKAVSPDEQSPALKRLVDLVEGQDLTSGKQPELDKPSSVAP